MSSVSWGHDSCYNLLMKLQVTLLLIVSSLVFAPQQIFAAKARVRAAVSKGSGVVTSGYSKAKLSRNTNSVIVTFVNLGSVSKITYTLSYTANGIEQGAVGSLVPSGSATDTRDLYFGTCSHGVCTPHRGIQNATLLVETSLKSGRLNVKRYRIKI